MPMPVVRAPSASSCRLSLDLPSTYSKRLQKPPSLQKLTESQPWPRHWSATSLQPPFLCTGDRQVASVGRWRALHNHQQGPGSCSFCFFFFFFDKTGPSHTSAPQPPKKEGVDLKYIHLSVSSLQAREPGIITPTPKPWRGRFKQFHLSKRLTPQA